MLVLEIKDLRVSIADKQVIKGLTASLSTGEIALLTGPNGSGKSSLANTLLGSKQWVITGGSVRFGGEDLLVMTPDERARAGLLVAWQTPIAIPGVSVFTLCKTAYEATGHKIESVVIFKKKLEELAGRVGLTAEHIGRSVNEGFSGGERKRLELLQILLLIPKLVILDEIDSGLDEAGRSMAAQIIQELKKRGAAIIVISHYKNLLENTKVEQRWEMNRGQLQTRV